MLKKSFIVVIILISASKSFCQNNKKDLINYEKNPIWIQLMKDTLVNYIEANKAFNIYWSVRPKPVEESEIIGHSELKKEERNNLLNNLFMSKKKRYSKESELYSFQYKKFKNWQRAMKPYVQANGSILTPSQRIAIWKEQQSK